MFKPKKTTDVLYAINFSMKSIGQIWGGKRAFSWYFFVCWKSSLYQSTNQYNLIELCDWMSLSFESSLALLESDSLGKNVEKRFIDWNFHSQKYRKIENITNRYIWLRTPIKINRYRSVWKGSTAGADRESEREFWRVIKIFMNFDFVKEIYLRIFSEFKQISLYIFLSLGEMLQSYRNETKRPIVIIQYCVPLLACDRLCVSFIARAAWLTS